MLPLGTADSTVGSGLCQFRKKRGDSVVASSTSGDRAPLAVFFYEAGKAPGVEDILAAAQSSGAFAVSHVAADAAGWVELLRDGLTFDLHGLSNGPAIDMPNVEQCLGLPPDGLNGAQAIVLSPGPHLAGAERLLPVIRGAVELALNLLRIGSPVAVGWIPARNAIAPSWFEKAVGPWLAGGAFPAMALVGIRPDVSGDLCSTGLKFLIGQEFHLSGDVSASREYRMKVAVRLVDWLVANGPVSGPCEVDLAGTGAVFLEATDSNRIVARCA